MESRAKLKELGVVFALLLVAAVCTNAVAADANDPNQNTVKKEVLTPLEQRMQKKIDVAFADTDIDVVIRAIAQEADLNVIKSPNVTGTVTAALTGVPLDEALSNILAAHGYGYVVDKNVIRVAPLEELGREEERLVSKVYRVTYADVDQVVQALTKFISGRGSISSNPGTSNIIVTDTESKIKAIDTFIAEIDRITPQILVEARVYDITSRDTLDLGVEWEAGRNTTIGNTIGNNPTAGDRRPFAIGQFFGDTAKTDFGAGNLRLGWLSGGIDIDAVIRAKCQNSDAKLLANPRILVLDNETALFDIVTEFPYSEVSTTGNTLTETIKWREIGVNLAVTPHVTRDGMVRLHITPEFSVLVREQEFESGTVVPVIDTRKVDTTTLIKDQQTVVLGGLRKKDISKQVNKVPLLGDLPLLGGLFKFEGEDTAITELVVFITPRIVEQPIIMSQQELTAYGETEFHGPEMSYTRTEKGETVCK